MVAFGFSYFTLCACVLQGITQIIRSFFKFFQNVAIYIIVFSVLQQLCWNFPTKFRLSKCLTNDIGEQ